MSLHHEFRWDARGFGNFAGQLEWAKFARGGPKVLRISPGRNGAKRNSCPFVLRTNSLQTASLFVEDATRFPDLASRPNRGTNAFPAGNAEFSGWRNHPGENLLMMATVTAMATKAVT